MIGLALAAMGAAATGCEDPRRAEIERRNAEYERLQTASQDLTPLLAPEPEPEKVDQLLACTPEKPGWPIDREACDQATERVRQAAEEDRDDPGLVAAQADGVNPGDL